MMLSRVTYQRPLKESWPPSSSPFWMRGMTCSRDIPSRRQASWSGIRSGCLLAGSIRRNLLGWPTHTAWVFHVKQLSSVSQNSQEGVILPAPEPREDASRLDPAFGDRVEYALLRVRTLPGKRAFNQRRVLNEVSEALRRERYASSVCTNWKQGMVPSRDTIRELAQILEVSPGWLAFGERQMTPDLATQQVLEAARLAREREAGEARQAKGGRPRAL